MNKNNVDTETASEKDKIDGTCNFAEKIAKPTAEMKSCKEEPN